MKDKKYSVRLGIAALALAVLLTACGGSSSSTAASSTTPESAPSTASVAAGSTPAGSMAEETTASSETAEAASENNVHVIDGVTFILHEVPNDHTGNWRFASISESFDMSEHALEYYKECFGSDSEIHYIINEADNTTTQINYAFGNLDVMVRERVDKEEFDAATLGDGSIQAEYFVDVSTGEIEQA